MSNQITRSEVDTLLIHMVTSAPVFAQAATRIKPECFDDGTELGHKLIWRATLEYHVEYKQMPTKQFLFDRVSSYVDGVPMLSDPNIYTAVMVQIEQLFTAIPEKDKIPEYALQNLNRFNFERNAQRNLAQLFSTGTVSPEAVAAELSKHRDVAQTYVYEPFGADARADIKIKPRDTTGVSFIDTLSGGGFRPHEIIGFLAPSGGGKTTLSNQIAISYAKRKRHVFVFTYEEPLTDEYLLPVYACAAQIDRTVIETAGSFSNLSPSDLKKVQEAKEDIGKYLHFVDMSGATSVKSGHGGPLEIENVLREYAEQGIKADAFFLDWLLPMMMRWMSHAPSAMARKNIEVRHFGQENVDALRAIAGKYHCWGWINHQLAPAEATKKKKMEHQAAAEFKSFSWLLNGCFTLNSLDTANSNSGDLFYSKARGTAKSSTVIYLKGGLATFVPISDDQTYDPNQRKIVKTTQYNATPRERPKNTSTTNANYSGLGSDQSGYSPVSQ